MTPRLTTNYAKNYCNRTLIVKVIVENVVTCFWGHGVCTLMRTVVYGHGPRHLIDMVVSVSQLTGRSHLHSAQKGNSIYRTITLPSH